MKLQINDVKNAAVIHLKTRCAYIYINTLHFTLSKSWHSVSLFTYQWELYCTLGAELENDILFYVTCLMWKRTSGTLGTAQARFWYCHFDLSLSCPVP